MNNSLRAIFLEALEIADAKGRSEYLDQACGTDLALRRSVEELIEAHQAAGGFLGGAGDTAFPQPPAGPGFFATVPPTLGNKIGRYKLLQQLGEGGCGVVYLAEQEEPVRRRVALKVIKLGMDTKSVIARFEAERQALALMDHPNIAKVLDAGATETGRPYFVMELVEGLRITGYCDQNHLSTTERLLLFTQVCHAIQHAHQKGVIHRDIKPSNILVTMHDGVPMPKVIDFGIAKATSDQRLTDKTVFTAFDQFLGTPAYMSPEQAEMSILDVDTRSDIYALGVLLYELLTGKTPFDASDLLASGLEAMRRTIREQEPVRPSTRLTTMTAADLSAVAEQRQCESAKLANSIRGDLDWIVMKALEKDRARRYETANGLAMDVERYLADEPIVARPPSRAYQFQKMVRRNKLLFSAASAVAAALVLGLGLSTWQFIEKSRAEREQNRLRAQAEADKKKAETEAGKSRQVAGFLEKMLEAVGPSRALGHDTTMLREILDKTAERVGIDLTNEPEVEVEVRLILAQTYDDLGLYPQMEAMARQSLELARAWLGPENEGVAFSLGKLGDALSHLNQPAAAEKCHRESLAMCKKLFGDEHPRVAAALDNLAIVLEQQGRLAEAETLQREGLAMQRKLLGHEHLEVVRSLHNLASVLHAEGKLREAETINRDVLALRMKLLGPEHPDVATSLNNLANVLHEQGKLAEAETMHREALAMRRKLFHDEHPVVADSIYNLANVLLAQNKLPEAETRHREALALRKKLLGPEHLDVALSLNNLAIVLKLQGKLPEAEAQHREALEMRRKLLGDQHPDVAASLNNLANVLRAEDRLADAERTHRQAVAMRRKLLGNEHPDTVISLYNLANVLLDEGELSEAETTHREVLATRRKRLDKEQPDLTMSLIKLALVLAGEKKLPEAENMLREALSVVRKPSLKDPSEEPPSLGVVLHHLADVLRRQKTFTEARLLAVEAVGQYKRHLDWPAGEREHAFVVLEGVLTDLGDFPALEVLLREQWQALRSQRAPGDPELTALIGQLTRVLLRENKFSQAEPFARECVIILEKKLPDDWRTFNARSVLGGVLLGQKHYVDAESLLRSGYEGMKQRQNKVPPESTPRLSEALQRLVQLYEGMDRPDQASEWKRKWAALEKPEE